jgi:Peptidase family S41
MYTLNLMKLLARAVLAAVVLAAGGIGQVRFVPATERPRPLSTRGLENLQAFARLFGYVRYFHPSDAAVTADWDQLAIHSIQTIEKAQSPSELAAYLTDALGPVSVAVAVYPTGTAAPAVHLKSDPYLIEWRHHGVGLSENDIYYSERVTRPASGKADEIDLLRADLPGGVSCIVPRVLYTNARGDFRSRNFGEKQPGASAGDRSVRLAAVVIAWNVLQHFYPYFDVVYSDWPQALTTALKSAATDEGPIPFLSTLRRMIAALHDGHGRVVITGADAIQSAVGWDWVEGRLVLTDVSHASDPTIRRGDTVIAINGRPANDVLAAAEAEISSATPQWLLARALGTGLHYNQALGAMGEGPKSEPLILDVEPFRPSAPARKVSLERQPVRQTVEPRPQPISEVDPGIFYVDVTRAKDDDFKAGLSRMEKARGLIFDMRGYPGSEMGIDFLRYLAREPMKSAPMLIPIVRYPDHRITDFDASGGWTLSPLTPYLGAKKVFLTNGRAISYSETIMAIVEQYRLGEIVGGPTAGTNGNTNPFAVPGGYQITWTGMKVLKHDGSQHHGVGVGATVPVSRTRAGVADGRDEVLERALSLLK